MHRMSKVTENILYSIGYDMVEKLESKIIPICMMNFWI